MASKRRTKPGRSEYWARAGMVAAALADAKDVHASTGIVRYYQHGDAEDFYAYIDLNVGDVDEARYDRIREIVNACGATLTITSRDMTDRDANLRVWLFGGDV